ncbi:assimilatory sulfite reductase (NADPH) flavoprotein subunit [Neisseria zalophi]|uniref:Sulfite reductase [NADPH] flavoprotein alpha-component n=1 Tax=Neisseria zalophi TaxID=640030 RepID=A0A5J6PTJ1_9NEIS|nr:assimilatory sulfite reductase (NADPH) flavoprotein subunit [Neisseria zalophi]QEY25845.1 assimilatory sulfite reductase (NADPH) flavoprotein subunit [Neisseria zalophi]
MNAIPTELMQALQNLTPQQLAWLSGWCWAKSDGTALPAAVNTATQTPATAAAPTAEALKITVLSASQTGNARQIADDLTARLKAAGLSVSHIHAGDYKTKQLADEKLLLLVTSTQGEGEPPEEAVSLHKFLTGKKAPNLNGLKFAVLGLGDSSYPQFCAAGNIFDARLAELGGTRLAERTDCDLDFQATAAAWLEKIVPIVEEQAGSATANNSVAIDASNEIHTPSLFHKENPFPAPLLVRQKITGRYSDKDVRHIELDLTGSGLQYRAGDTLGIWFDNDTALVDSILAAVQLDGSETIELNTQTKTIRDALIHDLEITQNTPQFTKGYAELAGNGELSAAVAADLHGFIATNPIAGLVEKYPAKLTATELSGLLRPISPRLYSIASAPEEAGEEVHLTVGTLRYNYNDKTYTGGASGYLTERLEEDGSVRVFIEHNPSFRLPENPNTPIIMIGAGTGIAPFRAFMQQRAATEAEGKNWLIFGNPHFSEDFLYQTEWQTLAKDGYLHKYSFAWSRDQKEKIYVQDKIRENAADVWQWLQDGAYLYVCGDAARMAKDVEAALLEVISREGGFNEEDAEEYLDNLRQEKRYRRDVY